MKKTALAILIAMAAVVFGCVDANKTKTCEELFQGEHALMCITQDSTSTDCRYMITRDNVARFMWQTNDTSFVMSSILIDKVRLRIDESVSEPYIKFRWRRCDSAPDLQTAISENVVYVLLVCSTDDCPSFINKDTSIAEKEEE